MVNLWIAKIRHTEIVKDTRAGHLGHERHFRRLVGVVLRELEPQAEGPSPAPLGSPWGGGSADPGSETGGNRQVGRSGKKANHSI